jgi:hypothetical protein
MALVILIVILSGVCVGGWHVQSRRRLIRYHKMDAEMEALRRAITDVQAL